MMGYQNGFVASILHGGLPVRESNVDNVRTARLPFGSEYQIKITNRRLIRAQVQILIDGVDVSSSGRFILPPGGSSVIERFVDSLQSGKKFKFISKEEGLKEGTLQDPYSDKIGLVEIRFWSERQNPALFTVHDSYSVPCSNTQWSCTTGTNPRSVGGTAEGSLSSQSFVIGDSFEVEPSYTSIVIRLLGPAVPENPWKIENGWVIKMPEKIKLSNTFRMENGELWVKM